MAVKPPPPAPFSAYGSPAAWSRQRSRYGVPGVPDAPPPPPAAPNSGPGFAFPNDAIALQQYAQSGLTRKTAAGDYLENVKRLALQFGDANLARQLVGGAATATSPYTGVKPNLGSYYAQFANAADPNKSYSWLAQHNRESQRAMTDTTNEMNAKNLYFSGHGAQALADVQYNEGAKLQQQLASVQDEARKAQQGYYGQLASAQNADISAAEDAYNRAVANAGKGYYELPPTAAPPKKVPPPPKPPVVSTKPKRPRYAAPTPFDQR